MLDKTFFIGAMLLIVGIVWSIATNSIGTTEWMLLLVGAVLDILAGMAQGWAIAQKEQGKIRTGKRNLYVVVTLIVFVALKVTLNITIPSYLAISQVGLWLSIIFAVGGLFLGRALYSLPLKPLPLLRSSLYLN
ncbi:hypothetical protein [Bacillus pseudomycoides]|uniref:hypothetical protein n=1 Tax=Bacillus pseudomycoides TaxID=64104 RepID=UPI000BF02C27|nr:hypothetical protein [Bacillus pseudomycoides]PEJ39840.1 hypothetical protein CN677_02905 [Bacillus pseudomycoides]PEM38181.1 hypothetical protein CN634_13430 [Bacillus pseudomycoides]PGE97701.1 hypothetical protein COM62_07915 [Bacillus pseudomycoides]PHA90491.1 hypothetical protein COE78_17785 [Bacillus pseudomycoides]PHC71619.1 hypothetical protein COF38_22670 [Bacillus pseudomycoides]